MGPNNHIMKKYILKSYLNNKFQYVIENKGRHQIYANKICTTRKKDMHFEKERSTKWANGWREHKHHLSLDPSKKNY